MYYFKKIITFTFVASFVFSVAYLSTDLSHTEPSHVPSDENIISTKTEKYTVKHYNGKISVFLGDQAEPIYTLDSPYVRDLPEYDQQLLATGIVAETKEELIKILEDYDN